MLSRVTLLIVLAVITALPISKMGPVQLHNPSASIAKDANPPLKPIAGAKPTLVVLVGFSDKTNTTSPTRISNILSGMNDYYGEDSYRIVSFPTTLSPSAHSQCDSLPHT